MKVCKKCKKKLANKIKICNHCGADVSKCKIIKNNSQVSKKEKNIISKSNEELQSIKETNILNFDFENQKISDDKKQEIKDKKTEKLEKTKIKKNEKIVIILNGVKESFIIKFRNIKSFFLKRKSKSVYKQERERKFLSIIKDKLRNAILKIKLRLKKEDNKKKIEKIKKEKKKDKELKKQKNKEQKRLKKDSKKQKNKEQKKLKKESRKQKIKENKESRKFKKIKKQRLKIDMNVKSNKIRSLLKNSKLLCFIRKKKVKIAFVVIVVLGLVSYFVFQTYSNFFDSENTIIVGEEATNNKLFAEGDIITYKGVNYQVLGVETSEGNNYKSPKEGNIFLIVTIQIDNNTNDKIEYSYKNWTMSNSLEEEEKRIFTSINVDTALYSGELVIGGIKRGSMVFEQPENDKKLKLNFYELKKTKDGKKDIDKEKKIFSVSIKVPKEVETISKVDEKQ